MGNALQTPPQIPQQHENPQVSTCEICIEPTEKKFRNGDDGSCHPFCTDCVVKYIRVKLEDNVGRIKCPAPSCDRTLSPRACESLVGPSLFVRWCDVLCEEAIVGLDRCYCPNAKCSALIVNECGGIVLGKSNCPECSKRFCFKCKRAWHDGGCEEIRDWNDVTFERLAETNKWMKCPRCSHFVELVSGCSIVKCRCGVSFCYKGGKQVHNHWCGCNVCVTERRECCCGCCILLGFLAIASFVSHVVVIYF